MGQWITYRFGDICDIFGRIGFRGYTTEDLVLEEKDGAISLSPSNILDGQIDLSKPTYIKWSKYYESPEIMLEKNDIVLSKTGTIGRTTIIEELPHPMTLNPQLVVLKNIKVNALFFSYYLKGPAFQELLASITVGSVIPTLSQKNLGNLQITLPEINTQERISRMLYSLDSKIKLNNCIIKNLETQLEARFVELLSESRIAIPLSMICEKITDGVHNSVKDCPGEPFYLLSCKNLKSGRITVGEKERRVDKNTFCKLRQRTHLSKWDILLSSVGTIGELVLVKEEPDMYEFQRSVAIIKASKEIGPFVVYSALKRQKNEIVHAAHGAVQQCLFLSDINKFEVVIPANPSDRLTFSKYAQATSIAISQFEKQNISLGKIRDTLLPKLMSGEIAV